MATVWHRNDHEYTWLSRSPKSLTPVMEDYVESVKPRLATGDYFLCPLSPKDTMRRLRWGLPLPSWAIVDQDVIYIWGEPGSFDPILQSAGLPPMAEEIRPGWRR
jgi:hypothetical protein